MIAQFQSLYPTGSLISELVQIYHGKYIVRVSVQIEGVTRATGLAAAETLEEAEDRARSRALMVVGITKAQPEKVAPVQLNTASSTISGFKESGYTTRNLLSQMETTTLTTSNDTDSQDNSVTSNDTDYQTSSQDIFVTPKSDVTFDIPKQNNGEVTPANIPEYNQIPTTSSTNVTPFVPRQRNLPEDEQTHEGSVKEKKSRSEPVDFSDVIAKTDVEMERLNWTKEQGRDHLKKTYGKLGRSLLTEEELLDFMRYLESQPTPPNPIDPIAGF